mgnify:CR=1 FL=1
MVKTSDVELPPRARRIPRDLAICPAHRGTTSACAENTGISGTTPTVKGNYLRVRGEYCLPPYLRNFCRELPPRARRIPGWAIGLDKLPGTTSACAENTGEISWPHHGSRNYLRVRGEYSISHTQISYDLELPPRARRILPSPLFNEFPHGTTSACAENTGLDHLANSIDRNYLRVRGEYQGHGILPGRWGNYLRVRGEYGR